MALARDIVSDQLVAELGRFEDQIRVLTADQWATASICDGWTVGDVARHVVGSMADVAAGNFDGLGTPEVTAREVNERAGRTPAELADECAEVAKAAAGLLPLFDDAAWAGSAPGGYEGTLGDGVEALWYDTWLHGNDILASLGQPLVTGDGLAGAISHIEFELAKRGWAGPRRGDDLQFILQATGRAEPTGPNPPLNVYA